MNPLRRAARKFFDLFSSEMATGYLFNSVDRMRFGRRTALEYLSLNEKCMYLGKGIDIRASKESPCRMNNVKSF